MESQGQFNLMELPAELIIETIKGLSFVNIHKLLTVSEQFRELSNIALSMKYDLDTLPNYVRIGGEFFDQDDGQNRIMDYFIKQGFLKCLVDYVFVVSDSDQLFCSRSYDWMLKKYLDENDLDKKRGSVELICPLEKFMTLFKIAALKRKLEEPLKIGVDHLIFAMDEITERHCSISMTNYQLLSYISESPNLDLSKFIDQVARKEDEELNQMFVKLIKDGKISEDILDYEKTGKLTLALAVRIGKHGDEPTVKVLIDKMDRDRLTWKCFIGGFRHNQDEEFMAEILSYSRPRLSHYDRHSLEAQLLTDERLPKNYFLAYKGFKMDDFSDNQLLETIKNNAGSVEASIGIFDCAVLLGKDAQLLINLIQKTSYEFNPFKIISAPFIEGISDIVLQTMISRITPGKQNYASITDYEEKSIISKNFANFQPETLHNWLNHCRREDESIFNIITKWVIYFHSNQQLLKVLDLCENEQFKKFMERALAFEYCVEKLENPDDKYSRCLIVRIYINLRTKSSINAHGANLEPLKDLFKGLFDKEMLKSYLETVAVGDCLELVKYWLECEQPKSS